MDDVQRGGPLSYDVTPSDNRDPSAQRGIILGLLTTVAAWVTAVAGGWCALGTVPDPRSVSRFFPLAIMGIALLVTFATTRETLRRPRRNALIIIGGVSSVVAILAFTTLATIKPTIPQIRQQLDDVPLPDGFRVVSEEKRGDRLCREGCPRVDRVYAAPENDPDPVRTVVLAMFANGWEQTSDVEPHLATTARRGSIFVQLAETAPHTVRVTASRQS